MTQQTTRTIATVGLILNSCAPLRVVSPRARSVPPTASWPTPLAEGRSVPITMVSSWRGRAPRRTHAPRIVQGGSGGTRVLTTADMKVVIQQRYGLEERQLLVMGRRARHRQRSTARQRPVQCHAEVIGVSGQGVRVVVRRRHHTASRERGRREVRCLQATTTHRRVRVQRHKPSIVQRRRRVQLIVKVAIGTGIPRDFLSVQLTVLIQGRRSRDNGSMRLRRRVVERNVHPRRRKPVMRR